VAKSVTNIILGFFFLIFLCWFNSIYPTVTVG